MTFEATRLAYDALLRSSWGEFADGLVDIAADGRIGDTGDNLDRQFYQSDAVHLTNAGNAVMASVAAPVLNAQPWLSSRCEMRLRDGAGEWGDWLPYAGARTLTSPAGEGLHVVGVEYRLDGGRAGLGDGRDLRGHGPADAARAAGRRRAARPSGAAALPRRRRAAVRAHLHRGRHRHDIARARAAHLRPPARAGRPSGRP